MAGKKPRTLPEPGRSEYQVEFLQKNTGIGPPVRDLLELQKRYFALDKQFQDEVWQLEQRHYERCQSLFRERAAVTKGSRPSGARSSPAPAARGGRGSKAPPSATQQGLPHFWQRAMKNSPQVAEWISKRDERALGHLNNIRIEFLKGRATGFRVLFDFDKNPFFENEVLTKEFTYKMASENDSIYGELMNDKATGCEIHWKPGMDLTEMAQAASSEFEFQSFFDFFDSTSWEDDEEDDDGDDGDDDDEDSALDADFELGEYFKDSLIPYAVHWYTGEARLYEDDDEEEEGGEEAD